MKRVAEWFRAQAGHMHLEFIPEPGSVPLLPREGYIRVWLAEGFLAQRRSWGNDHYPALHGGVTLNFLGAEPVSFTTVTAPSWSVPGVHLDQQVSPLVPYHGGVVTVEAALYRVSRKGPLGAAVQVLGAFAGLIGPPLATAATIAGKMAQGLDAVLEATGDQPELGVHWSMVAPGGAGRPVRAGHLAVLDAPMPRGPLTVENGRLRAGGEPPDVDYLLLRIECRQERDDPITPELDALMRRAAEEGLRGNLDSMRAFRKEAIIRAWNSTDLVPKDGRRVAKLIAAELDDARALGIVPSGELRSRLPDRDDPALKSLSLDDLLR
jgi:hypothetical protein